MVGENCVRQRTRGLCDRLCEACSTKLFGVQTLQSIYYGDLTFMFFFHWALSRPMPFKTNKLQRESIPWVAEFMQFRTSGEQDELCFNACEFGEENAAGESMRFLSWSLEVAGVGLSGASLQI